MLYLLFSEANHWRKRKNKAQIESAGNTGIEDRDITASDNEGEPPRGNGPPGEGT